jgi:hypothetical protein
MATKTMGIVRVARWAANVAWCQGYYEINRNADEILRQFGKLVELSLRPPKFETDIFALDVTKLRQALTHKIELRWWIGP